jgi:hypothetical protein
VKIKATGTIAGCVNTRGITSGTIEINAAGELNCLTGGSTSGIVGLRWDNGKFTRVAFPIVSLSLRPVGVSVNVVTGKAITGGYDDGVMVSTSVLLILDPTACLRGDVRSAGGPINITLTDL